MSCVSSPMPLIASCGLVCSDCLAYKATQANDQEKLAELAVKWGGDEGLKPEDMICHGCTSDTVYAHAKSCEVRQCAKDHGVKICSQCEEFSCEKVEGLWNKFNMDPEKTKARLEKAK